MSDFDIIFKPQTDLLIWNYIAHEIVYNRPEAIDWNFIKKNIIFTAGPVNIGYGMRRKGEKSLKDKYSDKEKEIIGEEMSHVVKDEEAPALEPYGYKAGQTMKHNPGTLAHWEISFNEYKRHLAPYTLDYVARLQR